MKRLILGVILLLGVSATILAQVTVSGSNGVDGNYASLTGNKQAFAKINGANQTGKTIEIKITASTNEDGKNSLNAGLWTSLIIYPTTTGLSITGANNSPLFVLDGADKVTFDGRVNLTGSTVSLTISNTTSGNQSETIRFINSAENNKVKYCNVTGAGTSATRGIINFSTSASGNGNDNNTIEYNNISGRHINAIYSSGSAGFDNSSNIVQNNNFYDFFNLGNAANGIDLEANSSVWTISGNSFYETAPLAPTSSVEYCFIRINNPSGVNFTITGNYIGGRAASCGGSALTKTVAFNNIFTGIYLNAGTATASNINNNTIRNINWSNSLNASWYGMQIAGGNVNIGTATGNTIGATTSTGSITVTGATTGSNVHGIYISGSGTVDCRNNSIGAITAANVAANASNLYGITKTVSAGTTTISNNTIGSTTTANSLNASSGSTGNAQTVIGIFNSGTGTITISGNTIARITNSTTNATAATAGLVNGIKSGAGTLTVSNNTVQDLAIANANTASDSTASAGGIVLTGNNYTKSVSGNTIFNLSNSYTSFAGTITGLYYFGKNTGTNEVKQNFIHSLSLSGASSNAASLNGIKATAGTTTFSNNIISIGGNTLTSVYGIYETGTSGNNNSLFFNTVYIGGSLTAGATNKSYALYSAVTTNTRDFRNNILFNARSTSGGSNLHYAIYIVSTGGTITGDFNDYFVSGTGGIPGYYGGNITALPIITGQDLSSLSVDPLLAVAGGTNALNYKPSETSLVAATIAGITTDYAGLTRSGTYPAIGAYEYTVSPGTWLWTGTSSTNWNTASNWNYNTVPLSSGNVIIRNVTNKPVVNEAPATPAECQNLTINSGSILTIAAGKALKVNGTLTNNAGVTGLVIKSDANGNDGKLLNNTASVNGTVELSFNGGLVGSLRIYHYFVPPVQSMTIGVNIPYPTIAEARISLGLSTSFTGDLLSYSEPAAGANKDNGWQFFDGWNSTAGFSSLVSTMGYNINSSANDIITFKGILNGGTHSFGPLSYTNQGWNLVGNPYPCNYILDGITLLTGIGDGVDNTIYFNHNGGYAYWNVGLNAGSTGYSNIMPPMQGFFVHVTASGQSLSLPVGYKTLGTAAPLRSKGLTLVKKIKLVLNNGDVPDETIVCVIDKATSGFDGDYDAYKFFGGGSSAPFIYTELNSVKYAINSVQDPDTSAIVIPVTTIIKSAGSYKIDITEFDNLDGFNVILKHGVDETILKKDASYSITSAAGTYNDFRLIISRAPNRVEKIPYKSIKTWYSNNYIYIQCPADLSSGRGSVIIYDIQGKPVYKNNLIYITPGQMVQLPVNLPAGLYIVRVMVNNQAFVSKIVVN